MKRNAEIEYLRRQNAEDEYQKIQNLKLICYEGNQ